MKKYARCPECKKELKVNETKFRSLLKTLGFRVIEVILDSIILSLFVPSFLIALGLSITIECLCFTLGFIWERFWNRIQWGRILKGKNGNGV